jgi:hypothetical protein
VFSNDVDYFFMRKTAMDSQGPAMTLSMIQPALCPEVSSKFYRRPFRHDADTSMSGGISAIKGFDYQSTVIIDRLFEHFDRDALRYVGFLT